MNNNSFDKSNALKIVFKNIRSLNKYLIETKNMINMYNIDILCLCESRVNNEQSDNEININGYDIWRCDRVSRQGGGCVIYTKKCPNIKYELILSENSNNFELIILRAKPFNSNPFLIGCLYRPPNTNAENDAIILDTLREHIDVEVIIGGDINKDMLNDINRQWFRRLEDLGLKQIITEPTRIAMDSISCIDHIYINTNRNIHSYGTLPHQISDHKPVYVKRKLNTGCIQKSNFHNIIEYNDWKSIDFNELSYDFNNMFNSYEYTDIDSGVYGFNMRLKCLFEQHVKKRRIRIRCDNNIPFLTPDIYDKMKKRNKIKQKFDDLKKKGINDSILFSLYKVLRNQITVNIRRLRRDYITNQLNENKFNSRKTWKIINGLMETNYTKKTKDIRHELDVNEMNNHFINVNNNHSNNISDIQENIPTVLEPFSLTSTTEEDIKEIIHKLDEKKSIGFDCISAKQLKCLPNIPLILTAIINLCFISANVPDLWKIAKVRALHKSGCLTNPSNYRPISVLPLISKIMEKIVYKKLFEYLTENKLLSKFQFGFRCAHSCTDALLSIIYDIYKNLNNMDKVCVITIDIRKAFDSVNHKLLLKKLQNIGCDQQSIQWFKSYLDSRKQFVRHKNKNSKTLTIKCGVPQGSVLGSLLFSIFINDLTDLPIDGQMFLYADDNTIICSAKEYNILEMKVNNTLKSINQWMKNNGFSLNYEKTNYMIINLSGRQISDFNINIDNHIIKRVNNTKILGTIFDEKMIFKDHINWIAKQLQSRIGLLYRLRKLLPEKTLTLIYKAIGQPIIDYSICCYGFTYRTHYNRIETLQRRALRAITGSDEHHSILYKSLNIFPFTLRKSYFALIFIFKCLNKLTPEICHNFFKIKTNNQRTRSVINKELIIPSTRLTVYKNTIFYSGAEMYNQLDLNIRNISSVKKFVLNIKTLFSNL